MNKSDLRDSSPFVHRAACIVHLNRHRNVQEGKIIFHNQTLEG